MLPRVRHPVRVRETGYCRYQRYWKVFENLRAISMEIEEKRQAPVPERFGTNCWKAAGVVWKNFALGRVWSRGIFRRQTRGRSPPKSVRTQGHVPLFIKTSFMSIWQVFLVNHTRPDMFVTDQRGYSQVLPWCWLVFADQGSTKWLSRLSEITETPISHGNFSLEFTHILLETSYCHRKFL